MFAAESQSPFLDTLDRDPSAARLYRRLTFRQAWLFNSFRRTHCHLANTRTVALLLSPSQHGFDQRSMGVETTISLFKLQNPTVCNPVERQAMGQCCTPEKCGRKRLRQGEARRRVERKGIKDDMLPGSTQLSACEG